jgi:hypothetical protein
MSAHRDRPAGARRVPRGRSRRGRGAAPAGSTADRARRRDPLRRRLPPAEIAVDEAGWRQPKAADTRRARRAGHVRAGARVVHRGRAERRRPTARNVISSPSERKVTALARCASGRPRPAGCPPMRPRRRRIVAGGEDEQIAGPSARTGAASRPDGASAEDGRRRSRRRADRPRPGRGRGAPRLTARISARRDAPPGRIVAPGRRQVRHDVHGRCVTVPRRSIDSARASPAASRAGRVRRRVRPPGAAAGDRGDLRTDARVEREARLVERGLERLGSERRRFRAASARAGRRRHVAAQRAMRESRRSAPATSAGEGVAS